MADGSRDGITVERDGAVATVILDSPDKRNALTLAAWRRLGEVCRELHGDESLRCVIVTGRGAHFAAGADISEFPEVRLSAAQAENYGAVVAGTLEALAHLTHPTVAVVRGACTGGGLEIACCCDLRLSGESGRYGVPINRLGHAFAYPEMLAVLSAAPPAVLLELLLEGRILDAREALAKGLVTRVAADDALEGEVAATVKRIAGGAPLANRASKRFLRRLIGDERLTEDEIRQSYSLCDSKDYKAGVAAFLEKRKPEFTGS